MFEQKDEPPIPMEAFYRRVLRFFFYSATILAFSLGIGMTGYRLFAGLSWVDAFFNASMILTGMGPVSPMPNTAAKLFSGGYALFSGVAFLSVAAVLFAPIAHRFLHLIHFDEDED